MGFLKSLLANILGFFISIFLIILIFIGIIAGIASSAGKKEVKVEEGSVLRLTFDNTIPEQPKRNPFEGLAALSDDFKTPVALKDILDCINTAKTDKNIKGIYMDLGLASNSYPTLDEVRNALLDFKKSGKFIYAYSEIYTQHSYYLASVADKVFINPQGAMDFTGFHSEQMFLKGLFDKLDVDMKLIRAGKYKSAGEMFNRKDMSAANREQLTAFINSSFNDFINKIADSRKISGDELRKISNELLVRFPADAVKYKLVDELAYKDQVLAALQAKLKKGAKDKIEFVDASEYTNIAEHNTSGGKDKIALIYAVGEIAGGEGSENSIGSEKLSKTIRKAREDDKIKAIVLRINSPGGSALASDIIWREVVLAQKKKPVIVSMGDLAASGGYYIAAPADVIVCEPTTITGSIGVFGLLPNLTKFWEKNLGITWDRVNTGKFSDLGNPNRPMTAEEEHIIQTYIDATYHDFKQRVAEGRKLKPEFVDSIAQGRIYSGLQAIKIGLVDKIGTMNDAIEIAAKKAKLDKYSLKIMPTDEVNFKSLFRGMSMVKESFMQTEMEKEFTIYKKLKEAQQRQGVLMLCPYDVMY